MEEMDRVRYVGRVWSFRASHFPQVFVRSPTWKLSEPHPFGSLWGRHYVGMID